MVETTVLAPAYCADLDDILKIEPKVTINVLHLFIVVPDLFGEKHIQSTPVFRAFFHAAGYAGH